MVDVYESATATPAAVAQGGVVCTGIGLQIGSPPVVGFSYSWLPITDLDDPAISNPTATPSATTDYTLTVTDDVTGCTADTSITIAFLDLTGETGGDRTVCTGENGALG